MTKERFNELSAFYEKLKDTESAVGMLKLIASGGGDVYVGSEERRVKIDDGALKGVLELYEDRLSTMSSQWDSM